ncbi:hypothetical protein VPH35_007831 [Triticum aestivum]
MVFVDGRRGRAAAPGGMPRRAAWQPLPHALPVPSHRLHRHAHLCQDRASMPPIYRAGVAASWLRHRTSSAAAAAAGRVPPLAPAEAEVSTMKTMSVDDIESSSNK